MRYSLSTDLTGLAAYLPRFLELAGGDRWRKRAVELTSSGMRSIFNAKIVADYHWLEVDLSKQMVIRESLGHLVPEQIDLPSLSSLYFAGAVVEVHECLTTRGRTVLEGRLRDGLKAETGFASLFLEIEIAQKLIDAGYDVEFSDMEGHAQYDLRFSNESFVGEVECKSLSVDAGRQIHRKDFYRFIDAIGPTISERTIAHAHEILIITLNGRLPADEQRQLELRAAAVQCLRADSPTDVKGSFFTIEREPYHAHIGEASFETEEVFYKSCRDSFGENCHVSGARTEDAACFVVMRSLKEDDHSKPLLDAMRKAAKQLSSTYPGFIAVQFDDVKPTELNNKSLRHRMGILSNMLFLHHHANHVGAIYFCVYGGLVNSQNGVGTPAFAVPNPAPKFEFDTSLVQPFFGHIPDAEFDSILGA